MQPSETIANMEDASPRTGGVSSCSSLLPGSPEHTYGERFATGFSRFLDSGEFADVVLVVPGKSTYQLHSLLLAYHSEFFRTAFSSDFAEKKLRRMELHLDDPFNVWPAVLHFFYTEQIVLLEENVFSILAIARQLLATRLVEYCRYAWQGVPTCNHWLQKSALPGCNPLFNDRYSTVSSATFILQALY